MDRNEILYEDVEDVEVELFIQALYLRYGYDFRNYSRAHMKRRIRHRMAKEGVKSIINLVDRAINDEDWLSYILSDFSINVTEMFRDPQMFPYLRQEVIPMLSAYPKFKIWHAGYSSGQEVYSTAILLMEEGLYDRATIYATDFNDKILEKAKEGSYPIDVMKEYRNNYIAAKGSYKFSDYYTLGHDSIMMKKELKKNIVFGNHNLVTDHVFAEVEMVMCRNVLIYFDRQLQNKVLGDF